MFHMLIRYFTLFISSAYLEKCISISKYDLYWTKIFLSSFLTENAKLDVFIKNEENDN